MSGKLGAVIEGCIEDWGRILGIFCRSVGRDFLGLD